MEDVDIKLPVNLDAKAIQPLIDKMCEYSNLRVTLKGTLKKYPGCIHWHLKRESERGTLEMTWSPRHPDTMLPRLWLSVHHNRTADWIEHLKPELRTMIETRLAVKQGLYD